MNKSFDSHKYILVAPSGTGKTTMAQALEDLGLTRCITSTTRPPRPGEIERDAYYFEKSFYGLDMFEQSEFGGYLYGITKEDLQMGDFVILEPQGVAFYRENYPGPLTVIALYRDGINVDPERRARDAGAGFDQVNPDITVYGETVETMRENLVAALILHEMERRRETGESFLPEYTSSMESLGMARLWYTDDEFDLFVSSEQTHREYREYYPGYDGLGCFEAADYKELCHAFDRMAQRGKECTLVFHLQDEKYNTLFSCRLSPEYGKIQGELYLDFLRMEPFTFAVKTSREALEFAFGGFISTENHCLGVRDFHGHSPKLVGDFRNAVADGRFTLHRYDTSRRKPSLNDQIRGAEKTARFRLEKMFDTKSNEFALTDSGR